MNTVTIDYAPQPYQLDWHNCPTRFQLIVTGRQVGKTYTVVNELIRRALTTTGTRNWYVTNDYKQAKRNVWDLFLQLVPKEANASFNASELSISFPNGSKIELVGVENAENLRGAKVHFMVLDEYDDFPKSTFPVVLEPMLTTTNGAVWFVGTPKGYRNLYSLYHSRDTDLSVSRVPACTLDDTGRTVTSVLSSYASIEAIQKALDRALETGTFDKFAQEYLAEFTKPAGAVYKAWNIDHFRPFQYDPALPLHVSFDWGVNDPTAIIWIQPSKTEIRVIDYEEFRDGSVERIAQVVRSKPYKTPDLYCGDPAGEARSQTTGTSPIQMLREYGIYVKVKHGVKIADQIRKAQGFISRLWVANPQAARFRDILINYRYPEKKESAVDQSNEKPIHDEWSHGARAFEYWAVNYSEFQPVSHGSVSYVGGDPVTGFGRKRVFRRKKSIDWLGD